MISFKRFFFSKLKLIYYVPRLQSVKIKQLIYKVSTNHNSHNKTKKPHLKSIA